MTDAPSQPEKVLPAAAAPADSAASPQPADAGPAAVAEPVAVVETAAVESSAAEPVVVESAATRSSEPEAPVAPPVEPVSPPVPPRAAVPPARAAEASGKPVLAVAALLLALAGVGVGGWAVMQLQAMQQQVEAQQSGVARALDEARSAASQYEAPLRQLRGQLAGLPAAADLAKDHNLLADLQRSQQELSGKVEQVLGAGRREWKLAEAEHLIRLASLRLAAMQDISSARSLMEAADGILREQDDPAAFAARTELARAVEALRLLQPVDRAGLFLQLGALGEKAAQANTRNPQFLPVDDSAPLAVDAAWYQRWWRDISRYVRIETDADQRVRPLLMGQTLEHLRLALRLGIEQAQWAALNGRPEVYQGAIKDARSVLEQYFGLDLAENQALFQRLGELQALPVAQPLPDLSAALNAMQAYLAQRAHADVKALEDRQAAEAARAAKEAASKDAAVKDAAVKEAAAKAATQGGSSQ